MTGTVLDIKKGHYKTSTCILMSTVFFQEIEKKLKINEKRGRIF
jgi:hypothetical protein